MKKDLLEKQKKALLTMKNEIISSLTGRSEQMEDLTKNGDSGDEVDNASDIIDRSLYNAIGAAEQERLAEIDSALERIATGSYGLCLDCGQEISQPRLEYIPYASLCLDCQAANERRNR